MEKNKIYEEKSVKNFRELVSSCTKDFGSRTAFTIKDKNKNLYDISFIDFDNNIKELGSALLDLSLERKKIAIIAPDRYEWCCSYFAISTANCIVVPLDFMLPKTELAHLIKESKVDAIIFDQRFLDLMKTIYDEEGSTVKHLICMDYDADKDGVLSFSSLLKKGRNLIDNNKSKYDNIVINKDELSVLIYTSGTTNNPKAVMLSQYNICSNVSAMTTLIKYEENDSILVFLPLHHTLACLASFIFCYYVGFRICFADSIKDVGKNL
ncbi:MAG: AMP-binding protein, partial [Clostridia bacterium]